MSARKALGFAVLLLAAAGSWYLAGTMREPAAPEPPPRTTGEGFYLRAVRILGTDHAGKLLYEIEADYAEQKANQEIEFENVEISYSPDATVPWMLSADSAVIGSDRRQVVLSGHVRAVSTNGLDGEETELRTAYLQLDPESFRAETDSRVQIRVGSRSLTATGMLALLQEDRLLLKSNVSGKFVP